MKTSFTIRKSADKNHSNHDCLQTTVLYLVITNMTMNEMKCSKICYPWKKQKLCLHLCCGKLRAFNFQGTFSTGSTGNYTIWKGFAVMKFVCKTKYDAKSLASTGGTASTGSPTQPTWLKSSPNSIF